MSATKTTNAQTGVKRKPTKAERANLKVLQKIRPSILEVVNSVLSSHGLKVVVSRIDFADAKSKLAANLEKECPMCCCAWGAYTCCTVC